MMPSAKLNPKPKPEPESGPTVFRFEAIGTSWVIEIYQDLDPRAEKLLLDQITAFIARFDKNYSRFRSDSLVTKMSKATGAYMLPEDAQPMFDLYKQLYAMSNGSVTPLIGQVLSDAGYDADYSLQPSKLASPPEWAAALDYNFPKLTIKRPALLDFGALGKGYLVDLLARLLEKHDYQSFCINAGGDIYCKNTEAPLQIGLEHPEDPTLAIGVASIDDQSLCGSAGNRRAWGPFHHIMDPHTLSSASHLKAVWATATTTMLADAMTTALYFVLPQTLKKHYTFEYALLKNDYSVEYSSGFPGKFFSEE
jgi:thiamine biosynthesis lipoprotein